jgi:hypothetical protein
VRLNYMKFKAAQGRAKLDKYAPRGADLDQIEALLRRAALIRARLVAANLPTVLTAARQHLVGQGDRSLARLLRLLSAGNEVAVHAVDTCDITRATLLESYLPWLLRRRFAAIAQASGGTVEPIASAATDVARARRREDLEAAVRKILAHAASIGIKGGT